MSNRVKTTFEADKKPHDRVMEQVVRDLENYKRKREKDERDLTRLLSQQAEQRTRAEIAAFQRSLQAAVDYYRKVDRLSKQYALDRNKAFSQFTRLPGSGAISSAAGALGVGLGAAGAVALTQQAIDKAIEQARANRLIASAATEAGLAQGVLAQKNREFAESVGLSNQAAAETTANITRLAVNSGDSSQGNIDRLLKSFADLGAARGIAGGDLNNLIGTILSGQDEGLNRLGIADPGQLQKAYAESIGKTVEALTQQEKVQAAVNAVVEKSQIFSGAAQARMDSLEGSVAKASAQWENFTANLATSFTQSYEFNALLDTLNKALGGMNQEVTSLAEKAAKGINIDIEVEAHAKDSGTVAFLKHLGIGLTASAGYLGRGIAPIVYPFSQAGGRELRRAGDNLLNIATDLTPEMQKIAQEELLRKQIDSTVKTNQLQEKSSFDQRISKLDADIARFRKERQDRAIEAETESLKRLLTKRNATVAELQKGLYVAMRLPGLTSDKREDLVQRFNNEIEQAVERQKRKLEELKKAREEAFQIGLSTKEGNTFLDQMEATEKRMQSMLTTTKDLGSAIRNALAGQILNQSERQLRGLRLDAQLDAIGLREQARDFGRGYRQGDEDQILREANRRLAPNWFTREGRESALQREIQVQRDIVNRERSADLDKRLRLLNPNDQIANAKLVQLAQSIDPATLNYQQRNQIKGAFEREADRKLNAEKEATDFFSLMKSLIGTGGKGVPVDLKGQVVTQVEVKSKDIDVDKRQRSVYGKPITTEDSML